MLSSLPPASSIFERNRLAVPGVEGLMFRRLIPVLGLAVFLTVLASPAYGCSCVSNEPVEMLRFGPTAFVGTVNSVTSGPDRDVVSFDVETVLAGEVGPTISVLAPPGGEGMCGIDSTIGNRLAVFASDEGGGILSASMCSVTDAESAIAALGPGTSPSPANVLATPFDWPAVWLGAGALVLVGGAWMLLRRLA